MIFVLVASLIFSNPLSLSVNVVRSESNEVVDVVVYSGPGAYRQGVEYLTLFLEKNGYTYRGIEESDILKGLLNKAKVIIMPGGWAGEVDEYGNRGYGSMSQEAIERIRSFVRKGGSYLGICAGAYFATKNVVWEGKLSNGYLGIFNGYTIGPIDKIAPWPLSQWTNVSVEYTLNLGFTRTSTLYWGGPYFNSTTTNYTVLERYGINGKPATILFKYNSGNIILTGLHHEWPNYANKTITDQNNAVLNWIIGYLVNKSSINDQSTRPSNTLLIFVGSTIMIGTIAVAAIIIKLKKKTIGFRQFFFLSSYREIS